VNIALHKSHVCHAFSDVFAIGEAAYVATEGGRKRLIWK
jgi:hypothetical protein